MRTFRGRNKLDHLLRAAEPVLNAVGFGAQRLDGQLGGKSRVGESCVLCHKSNLVNSNPRPVVRSKMLLEAFRERGRFRPGFNERTHQIGELLALHGLSEANARDAGVVEKVRKASFRKAGVEGLAIQKELRARSSKQQPGFAGRPDALLKLFPGGAELRSGAGML